MKITQLGPASTFKLIRKCNGGDYSQLIKIADQCDLLILDVLTKKTRIPCSTGLMDMIYRLDQKSLNHTPRAQHFTRKAIGKGIITTDNEEWKKERQKVQGMFGIVQMETLYDKVQSIVEKEFIDSNNTNINALQFFTRVTLQVTGNLLFGDISKEDCATIQESTSNMIMPVFRRVANPFYWISDPFGKEIRESKKKLSDTVTRCIEYARNSDTDNLVKKYFSEGYQTESILNLLTAGYETTSNAITWMYIELNNHPEAKKKIMDEMSDLSGEMDYRLLLEKTPFIQACFNEAIRLYPPIWLNGRITTADVDLDGYKIPQGSDILLSPYLFHHLPKYWTDAEKFIPERFFENKTPNDAYIPFGQGARSCIGTRLAILKACLITISLLKKYDFKMETKNIKPQFHFTLCPPEDLQMELVPIK